MQSTNPSKHNDLTPMTFDPTYVLHLGRLEKLRALLPKWAHENMENCKTHTLLPTHRFGIAAQASLHEGSKKKCFSIALGHTLVVLEMH